MREELPDVVCGEWECEFVLILLVVCLEVTLWFGSTIQALILQIIKEDFDIRVMVDDILAESGYADQRAAKMDVDDLLKLLAAFNVQGM